MKTSKDPRIDALRKEAEQRLKTELADLEEISLADAKVLIHDLKVHQVELEMQNEELRSAPVQLEESQHKVIDPNDFAPENMNEALMAEIAEHTKTEIALRTSEEKYRELVENANSIILRMDSQGRIIFFNEFARSFFGYSEGEILGRNVVGTIVPETASSGREMREMIRDISMHPEQYAKNESEHVLRSGERVWVLWTNKVLLDDRGVTKGVFCIGNDITERKRAEEALRLDEARLGALFELSRMQWVSMREISSFMLEKQVELTKSKVGWLGFLDEDEKVLTLHALSTKAKELCSVVDKPFHSSVEEGGLWAQALRERKAVIHNDYSSLHSDKKGLPQGHVPLSRYMSVPVFDGDRIVAIAGVGNKEEGYDFSDVRQLSLLLDGVWKIIERERAQKALRETESLSAMGRALAGVAHDMKTPLIAIGGFTRLVQGHLEQENPDCEKLDIVIKETQRLENLVKDMLDFAKPLELQRSMEDVNKVIEESLAVVEAAAGQMKVKVESRLSPNLPLISLDAMRMKQVIINLVMNAVQASPEGEVVIVQSQYKSGNLVVDIVDRGSGISPEKREEIFYSFVSSKKEGTGLGLSIVKKIVEAHRGQVSILDNPQRGIVFRVCIPRNEQSACAAGC